MRYPKDGLSLNRDRDYPVLRQLAHSGFATHEQLYEFMHLQGCGECRRSFNWRLLRLVKHGFIRRRTLSALGTEYVYALTQIGLLPLEETEDYFVIPWGSGRNSTEHLSALHSVELNRIHLSLARSGILKRWTPDLAIRSENRLSNSPVYAKDYDALIRLQLGGREVEFALEYERTPKPRAEYDGIASNLRGERHVDRVLYLLANEHLLRFVSWSFRSVDKRVYFGLAGDWHRQLIAMPAFSWRVKKFESLETLLVQ